MRVTVYYYIIREPRRATLVVTDVDRRRIERRHRNDARHTRNISPIGEMKEDMTLAQYRALRGMLLDEAHDITRD